MGTCVICGKAVDGKVCESHEEDVLFEFEGDSVSELRPNRYYRGSVDGFAEFGVFIDIAPGVTGLLHRSEIPSRLESLDWDAGDEVFVQVTGVHENGNIDLGWSIRQSPREFRHHLVQEPEGDREVDETADDGTESPVVRQAGGRSGIQEVSQGGSSDGGSGGVTSQAGVPTTDDTAVTRDEESDAESPTTESPVQPTAESREADDSATETSDESEGDEDEEAAAEPVAVTPDRVSIGSLNDRVGERVLLEAEVTDIHQTSGPTVFTLTDESGSVECAAFEAAGVRAYPDVETGDAVNLVGEVERRRDELQVETESLSVLDAEEQGAVRDRIETAQEERATPDEVEFLVDDETVREHEEEILQTATTIRRAIFEPRPVVIRHAATVDGYVAGAAIERAIMPLVEEVHDVDDAVYHYIDRQPLQSPYYDVGAATDDVVDMLSAAERHDEGHPLFVLVDAGSTAESADGFEFLDVYDADRVVIDGNDAEPEAVKPTVSAFLTGDRTSTVFATMVAATVNSNLGADLGHLPAVSYWDEPPTAYRDLAADNGYDEDDVQALREATALVAYYHNRQSKRELISDLFWDGRDDLAKYVSGQFRSKVTTELDSARPHVENVETDGVDLAVLDAHAYTHRFDFPPVDLLLDALHRERRTEADGPVATIAIDEDSLIYRTSDPVNARDLAVSVSEDIDDAGVRARGTTDGQLRFLRGRRDAVLDAAVDAVADHLRQQ